ncbi:non-specific serine/threonine protein kinase [Ranunculus cassubicifolius]
MTNGIYFNIYRDDDSCSTTSSNEISHLTNLDHASSSSLYFVISKACLSCAKPPIELEDDDKLLADIPPEPITVPVPPRSSLRSVSNKDIKTATRSFCFRFGPVLKGWIDENTLAPVKPGKGAAIVVKKLNQETDINRIAELNSLGNLCHCNLVKLFGYCTEAEQRLLVYEFMPRGSLDNHLFRKGSGCLLWWSVRMKVALEAAKGLAFLHSRDVNIIHGNFKSSHILLDSEYKAKISYLGPASHAPDDDINSVRNPRYVAFPDNCAGSFNHIIYLFESRCLASR